jgi:ATP-dependent DNA helicase RecQ
LAFALFGKEVEWKGMASSAQLHLLLKKHFGHDQFRPHQLEIIETILEGQDVFAVLPTGAGKSLCFQLPALLKPGITLVISPLIALMKDQVDALEANGIAATYLNSSITRQELSQRLESARRGEFKLLYTAPERLLMPDFLDGLKQLQISALAIDEAHCISEWGHDFRPEYRRLAEVRDLLPEAPMIAVTATATHRVRSDVMAQLKLRSPRLFVASFNRPNLTYSILAKRKAETQVISFIKKRNGASGIVYCLSRAGSEALALALKTEGIPALPYHAGLSAAERSRNQERFLRDQVQVMCATIAFGMGINKSNVRFVVHYDLPKNIEGYYQETGRAGRDGLHSECLLLYNRSDMAKLFRFIEDISEPREKQVAKQQLNQMVAYAETLSCRRSFLLDYFGEKYGHQNCGSCDNCLDPAPLVDATMAARKLLSCVFRVQQMSRFDVGLKWIINILRGESTPSISKHSHHTLSTFGIAKDISEETLMDVGAELMRRGFILRSEDQFRTVALTPEGREWLRSSAPLEMPERREQVSRKVAASKDKVFDPGLFEQLKALRKQIAEEKQVPAYVVFADSALQEMARRYPATVEEFNRIPGVGERKAAEYSAPFTQAVAEYLQNNPRQTFEAAPEPKSHRRSNNSASTGSEAPSIRREAPRPNPSSEDSLKLFLAGKSVEEIAEERELTPGTIYEHLVRSISAGIDIPISRFFNPGELAELAQGFQNHTELALKPVFDKLGGKFDYGKLRIYREYSQKAKPPN